MFIKNPLSKIIRFETVSSLSSIDWKIKDETFIVLFNVHYIKWNNVIKFRKIK